MEFSIFLGGLALLTGLLVAAIIFFLLHRALKAEQAAMEASTRAQTLLSRNKTLDRSSRMRTEFFQNMSHDFKTPLTVISTSLSNIEDLLNFDKLDKQEMQESIHHAQSEIMRLSRMIDNARQLSSLADSRADTETFDIASVLRESADTYRSFIKSKGNSFVTNIPKTLPYVSGNGDMFLHVLANLFSNTHRHTENGRIYFSAIEKNKTIVITLMDNGTGIPPEVLPRVFERGMTTTGTGLGLSICKDVIKNIHNGTISIDSKYGLGTQVTIELPIPTQNGE